MRRAECRVLSAEGRGPIARYWCRIPRTWGLVQRDRPRRAPATAGNVDAGVTVSPPRDRNRAAGHSRRWALECPSCSAGFTIIELLIVITIIVILASMGMVSYQNNVTRAREAVLKEDLFRMRDAIDQFHADQNKYPASLDDLVKEGYLRDVPEDPITRSRETWRTVPAEPDANDTNAEPGIYDVKSGAEQLSLDGSPYSEW